MLIKLAGAFWDAWRHLNGVGRNSGPIVKGAFAISVAVFIALWSAVILLT